MMGTAVALVAVLATVLAAVQAVALVVVRLWLIEPRINRLITFNIYDQFSNFVLM